MGEHRRDIDIAVIGAGVLGLATTDSLVRRGADVVCFDGRVPGSGLSGGLTRTFRHRHDDERHVALAVDGRAGFAEWERRSGKVLIGDEGAVYSRHGARRCEGAGPARGGAPLRGGRRAGLRLPRARPGGRSAARRPGGRSDPGPAHRRRARRLGARPDRQRPHPQRHRARRRRRRGDPDHRCHLPGPARRDRRGHRRTGTRPGRRDRHPAGVAAARAPALPGPGARAGPHPGVAVLGRPRRDLGRDGVRVSDRRHRAVCDRAHRHRGRHPVRPGRRPARGQHHPGRRPAGRRVRRAGAARTRPGTRGRTRLRDDQTAAWAATRSGPGTPPASRPSPGTTCSRWPPYSANSSPTPPWRTGCPTGWRTSGPELWSHRDGGPHAAGSR